MKRMQDSFDQGLLADGSVQQPLLPAHILLPASSDVSNKSDSSNAYSGSKPFCINLQRWWTPQMKQWQREGRCFWAISVVIA